MDKLSKTKGNKIQTTENTWISTLAITKTQQSEGTAQMQNPNWFCTAWAGVRGNDLDPIQEPENKLYRNLCITELLLFTCSLGILPLLPFPRDS